MRLQCVGTVLVSFLGLVSAGFAQTAPPRTLVPQNALATLRLESPGRLETLAPDAVDSMATTLAGLVGLEALDGLAPDRPWFAFAAQAGSASGIWFLVPVADRVAFDASVVGIPDGLGVAVDSGYALLGARPFPPGGGEVPSPRGDAVVALTARTGAIYDAFAEDMESAAVLGELDNQRARAEAMNEDYQPPFRWDAIRERVLPHDQPLFGSLDQIDLATLTVSISPESIALELQLDFDPDGPLGQLVALQSPARPAGLEYLSESSFYRQWMAVRLTEGVDIVDSYVETIASVMGVAGADFKHLVLGTTETVVGVQMVRGRIVTESMLVPKDRTVQDYRRTVRELHSGTTEPGALGIQRVYESDVARVRDLPVDRLAVYSGVDDGAEEPISQTVIAWGDDELFTAAVAGEDSGEAFSYLSDLVGRSPDGVPGELRADLDDVPDELLFLSWIDLAAWDRARTVGLIPAVSLDVTGPVWLMHGTSEGTALRLNAVADVAQIKTWQARQSEIDHAASDFFARGIDFLAGNGVERDSVAARELHEKAAALGHAEAMYSLGALYATGDGVDANQDEALSWYDKAAALGHADALVEAGHIYHYGRGRDVDYESAFGRYYAAAALGDPEGHYYLASMYDNGRGVEKDVAAATEWYLMAAEGGVVDAQHRLGQLYLGGSGVDRDPVEAERWFRAAAEQGHARAMSDVGSLLVQLDSDRTAEALNWYEKAFEAGDDLAAFHLAEAYRWGRGVEKDITHAIELYRRVSESSLPWHRSFSLFQLAQLYRMGTGVEKNMNEAVRLFEASFEAGYVRAAAVLAHIYWYEREGMADPALAIHWLDKSAHEHRDAANLYGWSYQQGRGVEKDDAKALEWFRKAAAMGSSTGEWAVGDALDRGLGAEQDSEQAVTWYRRSAERGYPRAQFSLGVNYLAGRGVEQDVEEAYFWLSLATSDNETEQWIGVRDLAAGRLSLDARARVDERIEAFTPIRR